MSDPIVGDGSAAQPVVISSTAFESLSRRQQEKPCIALATCADNVPLRGNPHIGFIVRIYSGAWPAPEGAETTHAAHFPMYVDKLCRLNEFAHVVNEFVRQLLEVDTVSVPRHWIGVLIQADIGMDVQAMAIAWLLKHGLEGI